MPSTNQFARIRPNYIILIFARHLIKKLNIKSTTIIQCIAWWMHVCLKMKERKAIKWLSVEVVIERSFIFSETWISLPASLCSNLEDTSGQHHRPLQVNAIEREVLSLCSEYFLPFCRSEAAVRMASFFTCSAAGVLTLRQLAPHAPLYTILFVYSNDISNSFCYSQGRYSERYILMAIEAPYRGLVSQLPSFVYSLWLSFA